MLDAAIISYAVSDKSRFLEMQRHGVSAEDFVDEYQTVWRYITRNKKEHDAVPSPDALRVRFPDLELPKIKKSDIPELLRQLKQRRKYMRFLGSLNQAADRATSFESVDEVIQSLQGELNNIAYSNGQNHLVDLLSKEVAIKMAKEVQARRAGKATGIPTGLQKFDSFTGGLGRQQMVTIIGRPGLGKSWLDLLFVANAVMSGYKVVLYPLEMTLFETAARLYTLFSQKMFGGQRVLRNHDIVMGKVTKKKVIRVLHALEDQFAGQLYVADVGSLADPYTNERIEAEVEVHQPDMFWVDYLTLLKPPTSSGGDSDWQAVRMLSNGIKNTAMRRNTVGGASAQVNREAMRANVFLPRLEHIAYGDSIGQDADKVISINKRRGYLYYALVKNRGGSEIGKTRVRFMVDEGRIEEYPEEADDEDSISAETGPASSGEGDSDD